MRRQRQAAAAAATAASLLLLRLLLPAPTWSLRAPDAQIGASTCPGAYRPAHGAIAEQVAAPWTAPPGVAFPWEGLHADLGRLLAVQSSQGRISLTFFTSAQAPLLLNCVYSLVKFGGVGGYIVATVDRESLEACRRLRLPCYDASAAVGGAFDGKGTADVVFGSTEYRTLVHAKPAVVHAVFRLGTPLLHFTDVDVSYLRPVWPSYEGLMAAAGGADAAFMSEFGHLNSGNFVLRYNNATAAMVRRWALVEDDAAGAAGSGSGGSGGAVVDATGLDGEDMQRRQEAQVAAQAAARAAAAASAWQRGGAAAERDKHLTDQELLRSLRGAAFEVCADPLTCQAVRAAGLAALVLHPPQFNVTSYTGHCPGRVDWPACAPYTLYVHAICTSGQAEKKGWLKHYRLWHLADDDATPVAGRHSYLPCADPVAWRAGGPGGEEPRAPSPSDGGHVFKAVGKPGEAGVA